jgi:hypothetical protein
LETSEEIDVSGIIAVIITILIITIIINEDILADGQCSLPIVQALNVTVSNVVTQDVTTKLGKPLTGVKAKSREVSKTMKHQEVCRSMGQSFLPVVFESQGLAGGQFLLHFNKLIARRLEEIGAPIAPLETYWSRRLSLTLQQSIAQAINIRTATLYTGPTGPIAAVDESVWPDVVASQSKASVGSSRWEL